MFKFGRADLTNAPRGDWTGLNFAYAVIFEIRSGVSRVWHVPWAPF